MNIKLRAETIADYSKISEAIMAAYKNIPYSNHKEQIMVERLRASNAFVPQLSIVAEDEGGMIAGYVLLTKIHIENNGVAYDGLALAPLSVSPAYQNKGIGKKLVIESHRVAKNLGFNFVIILGIPNYYPKFGYEFTSKYDIKLPFKISEENALIISLAGNDLSKIIGGTVVYSKAFFGD